MFKFLCQLNLSRKHGLCISKGALERSLSTNQPKTSPPVVSSSLPTNLQAFTSPFRKQRDRRPAISSSLLIQISSLRRNKNVLRSVIYNISSHLSQNVVNRGLSGVRPWYMTIWPRSACAAHQTRMSFYITTCRPRNLALRENYVSE